MSEKGAAGFEGFDARLVPVWLYRVQKLRQTVDRGKISARETTSFLLVQVLFAREGSNRATTRVPTLSEIASRYQTARN